MIKVTFVCLGNICRSPMAELVFKKLIKERNLAQKFFVDSCGTSSWEAGNPVYPPIKRTLEKHGVQGEHTARKITAGDIASSDWLLVMDESNYQNLLAIAPPEHSHKVYKLLSFTADARDVADPWYTRDFEKAYNDVVSGCTAFLEYLIRQSAV